MLQPCLFQQRHERLSHRARWTRFDVLGIDPHQLVRIEYRRRLLDVIPGELFDEFLPSKELLIAVRPPQSNQVIHHGIGQVPHVLIGHDRRRPMAF